MKVLICCVVFLMQIGIAQAEVFTSISNNNLSYSVQLLQSDPFANELKNLILSSPLIAQINSVSGSTVYQTTLPKASGQITLIESGNKLLFHAVSPLETISTVSTSDNYMAVSDTAAAAILLQMLSASKNSNITKSTGDVKDSNGVVIGQATDWTLRSGNSQLTCSNTPYFYENGSTGCIFIIQ